MKLDRLRQDWEELAEQDPLWAILSDDAMARGGWDVLEFFDTGDAEMDRVMARAQAFGHPTASRLALDFGCGVGRVTRPMSRYFDVAVGVDISTRIIRVRTPPQ